MPKWLKVLLLSVAGLSIVYGLTRVPRSGRPRTPSAPKDPVKLRLEGPRCRVTLEKKDGPWRMTDPVDWPADQGAIVRLTLGLASLAFESEVTDRAESHALYELDEGKAVRLQAWEKGAEAPFEVRLGKNAGLTDRAYAAVGAAPTVYLAAGLSRDAADLSTSSWRDRVLFWESEVLRVEAVRGKRRFAIEKSSGGWTVDGKPADEAKAGAFVSALRTLSADDLVDPPAAADLKNYGLDKPEAVFTVTFSTGAPVSLSLGRGDPRPAKKEGVDTLYLIPAYSASQLDKLPEDLLPSAGRRPN